MILITGASAGIGEATARLFAEKKRNLILLARRVERLHALAAELKGAKGIQVAVFELDVRDNEAVSDWAEREAALLAQVSVLVNSAGLARGVAPLQDGKVSDWEEMIETNVSGLLRITRALLPHFIQKRSGHIVNLGSVAGHHTYPGGNVYCATKFAVHALSESLRLDLNGTGIRVTEISPGMVETEFSEVRLGDPARAASGLSGNDFRFARGILPKRSRGRSSGPGM